MKIRILGTESLGVRGLSCLVETRDRRILIDPGVALGYTRHNLLPHPFQVAVGKVVRRKIVNAVKESTDIVISHYHGDHIPLVDANPFQLSAQAVSSSLVKPRLWCKGTQDISRQMANRWRNLSRFVKRELPNSEGQSEGPLSFSSSMPHGEENVSRRRVMMTKVDDGRDIFVHASDIQLMERAPIDFILSWNPDIVLASGPPLYLPHIHSGKKRKAYEYALMLAREVPTLILDHHLLRNKEGFRFLEKLTSEAGRKVYCAADYMGRCRLPLEAWRPILYKEM
ncbi:MAG: hypothetical protein JW925_12000, partial [Syntrophaceae bacterium]|nr:hypothetical protein [Syntrophaceae bacterium]